MAQSALSLSAQAAVDTHIADSSDAHDASAISIADAGGYFAGDTVEAITQVIGQELANGWIDDTAATWTYASATTFTVAGDRTAVFSKGTRIKLTQTTVKYFYVFASSHSAGTTTVTIWGGNDYSLANAAITANYLSYAANPQGFPGYFNFTPTFTGFSAAPTVNSCVVSLHGTLMTMELNATAGTSNATTFTISIPVGGAFASYQLCKVRNNSAELTAPGQVEFAGGTTLNIYRDLAFQAWTASGTKNAQFTISWWI